MTRIIMWLLLIGGTVQVLVSGSYFIASACVTADEIDSTNQRIIEAAALDGLNRPAGSPEHADALVQLNWSKHLAAELEADVRIERGARQFIGILWLAPGMVFLISAGLFRGLLEIRDRFDAFALYRRMGAESD